MNTPHTPHYCDDEKPSHPHVTHEEIAHRAHELWLEQGQPAGCDLDIWLEAEAELYAIKQKVFRHPSLHLNQR